MRRSIAGGLLVGGLAGGAAAQAPATTSMPGTPVGKPILQPVGTRLPQAVPNAGERVGTGPGGIPNPLDPLGPKPDGTPIKMDNVVAPYPGMAKPEPTFWEKLEKRWFALFQSDRPAVRANTWTPGIGRRNRERKEEREELRRRM
jgi:hypothetical protein